MSLQSTGGLRSRMNGDKMCLKRPQPQKAQPGASGRESFILSARLSHFVTTADQDTHAHTSHRNTARTHLPPLSWGQSGDRKTEGESVRRVERSQSPSLPLLFSSRTSPISTISTHNVRCFSSVFLILRRSAPSLSQCVERVPIPPPSRLLWH